jgi:hypothetical protein
MKKKMEAAHLSDTLASTNQTTLKLNTKEHHQNHYNLFKAGRIRNGHNSLTGGVLFLL